MPVYVTRAHVTLGDSSNKRKLRRLRVKHAFNISDICKTPFCFRTLFVSFVGLAVVSGGVVMTIIGYKPDILIPWYTYNNNTTLTNQTDTTAVPKVLGEPGPLRVLVYIGPILMGLGFFTMMMSIVLFCEIKDRYFNNILPATKKDDKKSKLYDTIISEFRKNYFRGIEVPLRKPTERRKSKSKTLSSLSRSGSLTSTSRLHSAKDGQKRKRKRSRDSQSERTTDSRAKRRSPLCRFLDPESWMKTSSLPNIRHKDSYVEMHEIYDIDRNFNDTSKRNSKSCDPHLDAMRSLNDTVGVDNPAYRHSPPDKRKRSFNKAIHNSIGYSESDPRVTTAVIHRESNNEEPAGRGRYGSTDRRKSKSLPQCYQRTKTEAAKPQQQGSLIDIEIDFSLDEAHEVQVKYIPNQHYFIPVTPDVNDTHEACTCGTSVFCTAHALGMDSGGSSMSLSWDNVPYEWSDARRNTEPLVLYPTSFTDTNQGCIDPELGQTQQTCSLQQSRSVNDNMISSHDNPPCNEHDTSPRRRGCVKESGPFKTKISVFKSDSNLPRVGRYALLRSCREDSVSLDSLDLTEQMLQNFEMKQTNPYS